MLSVAFQWKGYHFTYRQGNNLNKMVWITATPPTDRINWYKTINGTTTTVNTANSKYAGGSVAMTAILL
jgi:hypothetical protein